jgi:UDP-N-acetylmuramoylalanine--D-glutamate ligase
MAAYALCREVGVAAKDFSRALFSFKKPPHRIEFVRNHRNVSYYDDSKATSIDPVIKAVNSMLGSVILIAGGVHKGFSYLPWVTGFKQQVRLICAIGEAAGQIQRELAEYIPVVIFLTLEEAVSHAAKQARSGENVLLSPGCASLDMFKDFEQRGDTFKKIVWGLGEQIK